MTNRIRRIVPLAAFLAVAAGVPTQARAAACLDGYYGCLNDSWDTSGLAQILADIECFAGYVGCVRNQL